MTHSSSLPVFGGVCEEDGSKGFDPVEHNIVGHVTGGQSAQLVPVVPNGQIHKGTFSQSDYGKCVIVGLLNDSLSLTTMAGKDFIPNSLSASHLWPPSSMYKPSLS